MNPEQNNTDNTNTNISSLKAPLATPVAPDISASGSANSGKKKKLTLAGIIVGVIILIAGASAGAYYGLVVPNQPENVLKNAVANTLKRDELSGKGNASFKGKEGPAATIAYSLQANQTAMAGTVDVSVSGVKIPFEFKIFEKSAYVKFGDLSTIQSLVAGFGGPEAAAGVKQLAKKVSNRWIEFDESLIRSTLSDKCNLTQNISDQDVDKLIKFYDKNQFANIKSTTDEVIDDKKVTKFDLGFDKEKANGFAKEVETLDSVKNLKECSKDSNGSPDAKAEDFNGSVEFSIWVDKGKKEIVKIAVKTNSDKEGSVEADFVPSKEKVDIQKPEGAIPALQLLGELGPLLGGLGGGAGLPATNTSPSNNSLYGM